MKKIIAFLFAATLLSSCGGTPASSSASSIIPSSSSSIAPVSSSSIEKRVETVTITSNEIEIETSTGYPAPYEKEVGGRSFHFEDVMQGEKGKGSDSKKTIQIRKHSGIISTQENGYTGLTVFYYKNYVSYSDTDYTGTFTLYSSATLDGERVAVTTKVTEEEHLGQKAYRLEATLETGSYLFLLNESDYAINAYSLTFTYQA